MFQTANRKMIAPSSAIENELAEVARLVARPLGDTPIDRHVQEIAQRVVDSLCRLLRVSGCRLHVVEALTGPALQQLAASPISETPERPAGDAVTRSLKIGRARGGQGTR